MNNTECVVAVLARHRAARQWADDAVAADLLVQLGLDPAAEAEHATPAVDASLVTEDQVAAAEAAAKKATEEAAKLRAVLDRQKAPVEAATEAEHPEPTRAETRAAQRAEANVAQHAATRPHR
jgi:hypothetical protein